MKNLKPISILFLLIFLVSNIQAQNPIVMPKFLKKGDTVGILATARKIDLATLQPGIKLLESWGLHVVIGKTIGKV